VIEFLGDACWCLRAGFVDILESSILIFARPVEQFASRIFFRFSGIAAE